MNVFRRLRRFLAPFAIPNLTNVIIGGQVLSYAITLFISPDFSNRIDLQPSRIFAGEYWRLLTFPFCPIFPMGQLPIFAVIMLMARHLMGSEVERRLGTVDFNFFLITSFVGSATSACFGYWMTGIDASPLSGEPFSTVILAFAYFYPEFRFVYYFVIPVAMKWAALLQLGYLAWQFSQGLSSLQSGGWVTCLVLFATHLNLLLFFGPELLRRGMRLSSRTVASLPGAAKPARHTCAVCGATEQSHPQRDFRYCTQCEGTPAYCNEHLAGHEHRPAK